MNAAIANAIKETAPHNCRLAFTVPPRKMTQAATRSTASGNATANTLLSVAASFHSTTASGSTKNSPSTLLGRGTRRLRDGRFDLRGTFVGPIADSADHADVARHRLQHRLGGNADGQTTNSNRYKRGQVAQVEVEDWAIVRGGVRLLPR